MKAEIGIFGGSGFYELLKNPKKVKIKTPYGYPSAPVALGKVAGKMVAFMPRHGEKHQYPPHQIPYLANLWAFKHLGVKRIMAPCAAGSLQARIKPGDFVVCDQFIDRTEGRPDTFYNGPKVVHISSADPYCPILRKLAVQSCRRLKIPVHDKGTVIVIQGPRLSSKAESRWFSKMGWEVINMTQYPEVILARELELCYVNISLITDYDAGLEGQKGVAPANVAEILKVFKDNNQKLKKLIIAMIEEMPERNCQCGESLKGAVV